MLSPFHIITGRTKTAAEEPSLLSALPGIGAVAGGAYGVMRPHQILPGSVSAELGRHKVLAGLLGAATGASLGWLPSTIKDTHAYFEHRARKHLGIQPDRSFQKRAYTSAVDVKTDPDTSSVPGDPGEQTGESVYNGTTESVWGEDTGSSDSRSATMLTPGAGPVPGASIGNFHKGGPIKRDGFLTDRRGNVVAKVHAGERVISKKEVAERGKRKIAGPILALMLRHLRNTAVGTPENEVAQRRRKLMY